MEESFDRDVRPYLDLVDTLRHIGVHQEISLPQIAVMGDQVSEGRRNSVYVLQLIGITIFLN